MLDKDKFIFSARINIHLITMHGMATTTFFTSAVPGFVVVGSVCVCGGGKIERR